MAVNDDLGTLAKALKTISHALGIYWFDEELNAIPTEVAPAVSETTPKVVD